MNQYTPTDLEAFVRQRAPEIAKGIQQAAKRSNNEADLVAEVEDVLKKFEESFDVTLKLERERTLINGRADAVYNRFVVEYEPPKSLRKQSSFRHNQHAIRQVKQYMDELSRLDRHRKERLAGVVLDGYFYIFVRYREGHWRVDDPIPVSGHSTETFLRYLLSLSTELALTPENLLRDFGENTIVSRLCVSTLYNALGSGDCPPRVNVLFEQWQRQFGEITGWKKQSGRLDLPRFARNFGIDDRNPDPLRFFFSVHTYYATFIKLLAVQIATFYLMPKVGSGLAQVASSESEILRAYLSKMERGGIFSDFGIKNFLEGDFFGWYLDLWDKDIDTAIRRLIGDLANYSLVTLDVDPEETRDLLKKLYQNLMPKKLRHDLGEYYTPDWLAERLLNQLGYDGNPNKRLLDPACGSGTFLVLTIKRVRQYAEEKMLPPAQVLELVLDNVVGFDLNPLAVISSRTNYLLALGDLLAHRQGDVSIPVYLADSILTPSSGRDLFSQNMYSFNTAVGKFSVPRTLVDARYIDELAQLLEECVGIRLTPEQFKSRLHEVFPFDEKVDAAQIDIAVNLYLQLLDLDEKGINGIWARIIKNAFAPLFQGQFDFIAGNPPWVNWANLPDEYRNETASLWQYYNLFPHRGLQARLGGAMDDISVLMLYVAMDKYLKANNKLGFIITQTLFQTEGGGAGFRRFQLGEKEHIKVLFLDDMSSLQPFEGATNRTAVVIIQKGNRTTYPVSTAYWRKKVRGFSLSTDLSLEEVISNTKRLGWVAKPIDVEKPTSPWLIGRDKSIDGILKCLGSSIYQARYGVHTHKNGAYWVDVLDSLPDKNLVVSNLGHLSRPDIESIQTSVESRFVYPLLRGRDVTQWSFDPVYSIILAQDPDQPSKAYPESNLATHYPKTYSYFAYFKDELINRSGYKQFFDPSVDPFYSVYNIGSYTFAPYKCVWREQSSFLTTAVISQGNNKVIIPDHKLMLCPFEDELEANYLCACLSSSISQFIVKSYTIETQIATHVLRYIKIPQFNTDNQIHQQLAVLSMRAHEFVSRNSQNNLREIEEEIDSLMANMFDLTEKEMNDIQESLEEIRG